MNIKQFSEQTGLSRHTIRYYEKIGLIRHVRRNSSGHRDFTENDISLAGFVKRLKDTGMPLEQILEYAQLREKGESTLQSRMALLVNHAALLEDKIAVEQEHLHKLHEKIHYYKNLINT